MKIRSIVYICLALVIAVSTNGCAGKRKLQTTPKDPAILYTEGMVLFNKGEYARAIEVFNRLKDYFPSDQLFASKADLRIADCYFFRKDYAEASTRYLEFKKQYPFHADLPYVEYQVGLCYFRQILSKDRDQKATFRALTAFQNVVANYPESIFAEKAQEKIEFCRRRLAENELYIAQFYLRHGKYLAAEKRSEAALAKYPESGVDDEALYCLALALHKQERDAEALTPLRELVRHYPQSTFAKPAQKLLASIKDKATEATAPAGEQGEREVSQMTKTASARNLPFRINAKKTKKIIDKNQVLYTGDVVALGEEVTIRCESLLVTLDEDNLPKEMVAMQEVHVKTTRHEIFAQKAVLSPQDRTIVMTENAKIREEGDWIRGDEIILYLDTGKLEIKGRKVDTLPGVRKE